MSFLAQSMHETILRQHLGNTKQYTWRDEKHNIIIVDGLSDSNVVLSHGDAAPLRLS